MLSGNGQKTEQFHLGISQSYEETASSQGRWHQVYRFDLHRSQKIRINTGKNPANNVQLFAGIGTVQSIHSSAQASQAEKPRNSLNTTCEIMIRCCLLRACSECTLGYIMEYAWGWTESKKTWQEAEQRNVKTNLLLHE